jgi:hypothetical protein
MCHEETVVLRGTLASSLSTLGPRKPNSMAVCGRCRRQRRGRRGLSHGKGFLRPPPGPLPGSRTRKNHRPVHAAGHAYSASSYFLT